MNDLVNRVLELAVQIQQIPAPTFEESRRAEFVCALFAQNGLESVSLDQAGNAYGRWSPQGPRTGGGLPLIVSAHLDTVFPMSTDLTIRRNAAQIHGPGIGDNSLGVASLLGLLWMLRERKIETGGEIWFVANVCEEGLGDLRGMKAVVDRFGGDIRAYLVLEGLALGHVYHRAVGVKRYRVTARTNGGHSWSDYGRPSAIHELAKLVVQMSSMDLPSHPRTTMNVGRISGGTSVNVIASDAVMDLDLRSEGQEALAQLVATAERLIQNANRQEVSVQAEVIGQRPAGQISPRHPLVELGEECLRELGLNPVLIAGSTDANIPLSRGYPAVVLGVTTGGSAHTVHEFIHTEPVALGMEQLARFVSRAWK